MFTSEMRLRARPSLANVGCWTPFNSIIYTFERDVSGVELLAIFLLCYYASFFEIVLRTNSKAHGTAFPEAGSALGLRVGSMLGLDFFFVFYRFTSPSPLTD